MENYVYYFLAIAVMVLSLIAQSRVQSVFNKYAQVRTVRGVTGAQLAAELLAKNGISMPVTQVSGSLTDHFDPKNQVVGLSQSVYNFDSVSALAVAAHEIGHVLQYNEDYRPMKLRTAILPVANIGCRIGPFLVIGGLLLSLLVENIGNTGYYIAMVGVVLYVAMLLFQLVTLPVEFNASNRGLSMLTEGGYLTAEELPGAKKMLRAAAYTYVLAALGSFVTVLRLLSLATGAKRR
ncbi:MAG: zinc metallopeptidase [Clostridia bacterium]|nr:zinc metallopeptidase [Clostridia bacterium]